MRTLRIGSLILYCSTVLYVVLPPRSVHAHGMWKVFASDAKFGSLDEWWVDVEGHMNLNNLAVLHFGETVEG